MTRMRFAATVTITVLGTLLIAAVGYGGMAAARSHPTAEIHPVPPATPRASPRPPVSPSPSAIPPASPALVGTHIVWDEDLVDPEWIWLLLSDCNAESSPTCHYSVARSQSGGTWSAPVIVGPSFSSQDGDAPRAIRFLDPTNGFVYGHNSAFVTHDGGVSWADAGFKGEVVGIAGFETTAWAVNRPCAKGVACPYEVRWSKDSGVSWSASHQLPSAFAPESLAAFGSGVIVSALPPGGFEMTADQGVSWQEIKSPCAASQFRSRATTADGIGIWVLCQGYPDPNGAINDASIFVTSDGGRNWSRLSAPGILPAWLVSPKPKVALADNGSGFIVLTADSGVTWSRVAMGDGAFVLGRFTSPNRGWAMDVTRHVWWTYDAGNNWVMVTILPNTLP